jgi:hypothetical protein
MIKEEELEELGFFPNWNTFEFYDGFSCDWMYNIKTQTLYAHCEYSGDLDEMAVFTKEEDLKEFLETNFRSKEYKSGEDKIVFSSEKNRISNKLSVYCGSKQQK